MYSIEHVVMDIIYTNFYWVQTIHNSRRLLSGSTRLHIYITTPPSEFFPTHPEKNIKILFKYKFKLLYLSSNTLLGYITLKKGA